jgi:hypothetical protein
MEARDTYEFVLTRWFTKLLSNAEQETVNSLINKTNSIFDSINDLKNISIVDIRDVFRGYHAPEDPANWEPDTGGELRDNSELTPTSIIAYSCGNYGGCPCTPFAFYSSLETAILGELSLYLWVENDFEEFVYTKYIPVCKQFYILMLLHRELGDLEKACMIARELFENFPHSDLGAFHTIEQYVRSYDKDNVRVDWIENVDEFESMFGKSITKCNFHNSKEWAWLISHFREGGLV